MKKEYLVLSCAYPSAGHTMIIIAASMWLHKNILGNKKNNYVNISLLPNPRNMKISIIFFDFFVIIYNWFPSFIKKLILKNLEFIIEKRKQKKKSTVNVTINKILKKLKNNITPKKKSFYNDLNLSKNLRLEIENFKGAIFKTKLSNLNLFYYLKILFISFKLLCSCVKNLNFDKQKFLKLHYQNIQIGDLIAAFNIRTNPKTGGELKFSFPLFLNLYQGVNIINKCEKIALKEYNGVYIIPTEPWYIHQIWVRKLNSIGVKIIDIHTGDNNFEIRHNTKYLLKNYKVSRGKHSKDYKKISKSWLDRKLYYKSVVDTFLKKNFSNKNDTKYVYDINKKIIEFDKNNLSVVIFSQNLEDALYDDGLDGFDDVFHWLKFTINNCLENKNISKIYIKLHPNIDELNYPSNYHALRKLLISYATNKKVIFLNKTSSLIALCKNLKFYGITRCGSVAEEIVYLGQPMIGWANGPWSDEFKFLIKWKSVNDYDRVLKSLSIKKWKETNIKELNELYSYVFNQLQKLKKTSQRQTLRLFITNKIANKRNWDHIQYENKISGIEYNSKMFKQILNIIYTEYV